MRTFNIFAVTLLSACALLGQGPAGGPIVHIQAELETAVKLAKVKTGDKLKAKTVSAVTLADGTAIPVGSTLLGQVLQVDGSSVTLAFDQANADGKKVPLSITLVAAALMGGPRNEMSENTGNAKMDSPTGGSLPNDHPLRGGPYAVSEAGVNALNGVNHESLALVNSAGASKTVKQGADAPAHAGSVIGLPGVALTIDDGAPYASKFDLKNKDGQLPKGVQLMFSVR
jgi:hypothetical protein